MSQGAKLERLVATNIKVSGSYPVPSGQFREEGMMNVDVLRTYAVCGPIFEIQISGFGKLKTDFGLDKGFFQL